VRSANDYDSVAHLYDAYVRADFDLDFFRRRASRYAGPVLDLMAGTGRVSCTIQRASQRLTCVDISLEMLRVLRRNLAGLVPAPLVVCADIRSLPLVADRYELALIPFNSLAELITTEDQREALNEVRQVLRVGGHLICTLHNPALRVQSLDERRKLLGTYQLPEDRQLEVWVRGSVDRVTDVVCSVQTYRIYGSRGELEAEQTQEIRFALIARESFEGLAVDAGFRVVELLGDYDGSSFTPDVSPYMIWTMEKVE